MNLWLCFRVRHSEWGPQASKTREAARRFQLSGYPPVNIQKTTVWKITIFNGYIHYTWSFSIAMLNYQRVYVAIQFVKVTGRTEDLTEKSSVRLRLDDPFRYLKYSQHI